MYLANKITSGLMKVILALALMAAASVNAAPITSGSLGLVSSNPDIQSNFLSFDYVATTSQLNIDGYADTFFQDTSIQTISSGTFSISGTADGANASLGLTIFGDIGAGAETLLTGVLTSMSYDSGVFEFIFGGLGGSLAALYGSEAGVIFTDSSTSGFAFNSDFSSQWTGFSDTFAIPVSAPGTASLGILGLLVLTFACRKRV